MRTPIHVYAFVLLAGIGLGWIARSLPGRTPDPNPQQQAGRAAAGAAREAQPIMGPKTPVRHLTSGAVADFVKRHVQNGEITGEGMVGAIEEMNKVTDPLLRREFFAILLDHLNTENAAGAYKTLVRHSKIQAGKDPEILLVANVWGRLAPHEALKSISKILRGSHEVWDNPDMAEVLAGWAMTAPDEASGFLESTAGKKELLTDGFVRGLISRRTDEAMTYLLKIPATSGNLAARQNYMGMITNDVLKRNGFESATNWLSTITDESLKAGGFTQIAEDTKSLRGDTKSLVGTAVDARIWIARHAADDAAKNAIGILAGQWAKDSPESAIKWADDFPESIKEMVYGDAMGIWAQRHAQNASRFLDTLPPSRERDSAVGEFSTIIARDEPVSAIKWAETIKDEAKRAEALKSIAATWLKSDYGAAVNWLAGRDFLNISKQ